MNGQKLCEKRQPANLSCRRSPKATRLRVRVMDRGCARHPTLHLSQSSSSSPDSLGCIPAMIMSVRGPDGAYPQRTGQSLFEESISSRLTKTQPDDNLKRQSFTPRKSQHKLRADL